MSQILLWKVSGVGEVVPSLKLRKVLEVGSVGVVSQWPEVQRLEPQSRRDGFYMERGALSEAWSRG